MPKVLLIRARTTPVAYVVDKSVGLGCVNERADVLLVQHLLRVAWEEVGDSKGFRPPGESVPLQVDGIWGPKSQKFLNHFQAEANKRGAGVLQDQRVDPCTSGKTRSTRSKTFYTILALNAARNSRHRSNYADITLDPGFPTELTNDFYLDWPE